MVTGRRLVLWTAGLNDDIGGPGKVTEAARFQFPCIGALVLAMLGWPEDITRSSSKCLSVTGQGARWTAGRGRTLLSDMINPKP